MPEYQDSQYSYDKPWQLTSEALSNARTWWQASPPWYPPTPTSSNPYEMVPPRFGYRDTELTVNDVLEGVYSRLDSTSHAGDTMPDDFSGQTGSYEGTMRPTGAGGGGIV